MRMCLLPHNPVSTLYSMLRHPYVGREQLIAFQNERLRLTIDHAYGHVAYYRRLFDRHGLTPRDIRTVEDLAAVPVTSRSDLQGLPVEDIIARTVKPGSLITRSSSGSSGKPFMVYRTWLEERVHGLLRWRALHGLGLRASDKICIVMGLQSPQRRDHQLIQRIMATFGIARQRVINALQSPEDIVQELKRHRPAVVSGYPGVLARIARTVNSEELKSLRLRFVNTGGEVLTPLMRHQIQEGFSVPVYDTYGSIEFNLLAWQCGMTDELHCCDDGMILEVVKVDHPVKEGETGEVVGTDLHSFAMPLIRYQLGDVATKGSQICGCGKPFSTIRSIQGRILDYFRLPDGRLIHPYEFPLGREKLPWIREFQITQHCGDRIVMKAVPLHRPSSDELCALTKPMEKLLGRNVTFEVELVLDIPRETTGKYRVYRSFVQPGRDKEVRPDCTNVIKSNGSKD